MNALPESLYTAEQVRELDRRAIEDAGIGGYALMRRAGDAAFHCLRRRWPEARRLVVLAGRGNNGGDGYVIARRAVEAGWPALVLRLGDHEGLQGAAGDAARDYQQAGGECRDFDGSLPEAELYVDAMLGTGLDRSLKGAIREAVDALNAGSVPVFAVDLPTGLNADTGAVMGTAVRAGATASFIGLKLGLFTGEAPALCGPVHYDVLDVPASVFDGIEPAADRITDAWLNRILPPRLRTAHKGRYGHVLVMGGDTGMGGAARLAGEAALRCGAGLVSVATRGEHVPGLVAGRPELMGRGVTGPEDLAPLVEHATVIALGPGLGTADWGRSLWEAAMASGLPLVVDADGLNLLAASRRERGDWVLTPHPGEAARLLDCDTAAVQADRPAAARKLAETYGGVAVLKGAGTLVAGPGGRLRLCDRGNPGMATGGMGDVLTGLVTGLLAQGLEPFDAAAAAVALHAEAADRAAAKGERGLLASHLFGPLRSLINPATHGR